MLMDSQYSMFDVQNIYGTPQIPRKRPCLRPRRMTLIDLRNVPLNEEETPQRKGSSGTIRSEGRLPHDATKSIGGGVLPTYTSSDSINSHRSSNSSMRIRRIPSLLDGSTRFPKLEECAHFHYDFVELGPLQVNLCEEDRENYHHNESDGDGGGDHTYLIRVTSNGKGWTVRRTYLNFCMLDRQLHKCIYDRKFSHLVELSRDEENAKTNQELEMLLGRYLSRFSEIADSMLNCGSVLNWLEIDNRGNRLLAVDDSGINTPAIAAAHVVKRYNSQAADEISLEVGDIVSVIDMPPPDDTIWWRGKRGFEVGFFPSECVEVIGDKVPSSVASRIPQPSASRKPLLRKHGKLITFLRTFFSTRPARNQLKQSGIVKERVFGCDLGEHLLNSGHDVPLVLKSCTEVIERHGIVDGIYRLSGITSNIQKLRLAFDEDRVPDLTSDCYLQDIHSISSLLKMYLRELPNPLLTYQLYDKFADAVRDEDNKLLKIHDVVQQLPPPHYRTTEYLMRHLARVAGYGLETGMHSKNLAIVWAPNLLRSKELEMGGGAAALQGVGIQAVVTECLICYCDIIFSDKMPSYSSPDLHKSQKKPRPKSLAISTPTRLLSLEEARERAFVGNLGLNPNQRYIDVGGGPQNLPNKYHTVIDLPGYRKKLSSKESVKGKKSPVSGWKSFFSKPRSGSIKKARKQSDHGLPDTVSLGHSSQQAKALTEDDVHQWKKRLRTAKSAESLLSLASSSRSSSSHASKVNDNLMVVNVYGEEKRHMYHKRSLSSDATAILHHHSMYDGNREMAVDVNLGNDNHVTGTPTKGRKSRVDRPERQESFVRGDKTRQALHRRTPSAPNTPRNERSSSATRQKNSTPHKTFSQPALESRDPQHHYNGDESFSSEEAMDDEVTFRPRGDPATLVQVEQQGGMVTYIPRSDNREPGGVRRQGKSSSRSAEELTAHKRGAKSSPQSRKKAKGCGGEKSVGFAKHNDEVDSQNGGASSKRVQIDDAPVNKPIETQYFYSRHHDYAEILSDGESGDKVKEKSGSKETLINSDSQSKDSSFVCSPTSMTSLIDHIDQQFSGRVHFHLESPDRSPENRRGASSEENQVHTNTRDGQLVSEIKTENISTRPTDFQEVGSLQFKQVSAPEQSPHLPSSIEVLESNIKKIQHKPPPHMSKCLSVPLDIAKSLENVTSDSNFDLMSSVTISELSQSVDSFNLSLCGDSPMGDARRRRSASLDSLTDSPMTRTLREINLQIDTAFKRDVDRALELEDKGYNRHASSDNMMPLHIDEETITPTNPPEIDFPEYARIDKRKNTSTAVNKRHSGLFIELSPDKKISPTKEFDIISGNIRSPQRKVEFPREDSFPNIVPNKMNGNSPVDSAEKSSYIDRPSEIRIVETPAPQVIRAPLHVQQQQSVEQASITNVANICAQQDSSSSSSSSSSDSESDSSTASDSITSSVEFISHQPSPRSPRTQLQSDHSSPSAVSRRLGSYSAGCDSDAIDDLQWRQSPVFADVSQFVYGGRKSKTSPVDSGGQRSSPSVHFGSASSTDSSPRPSPRASPRQLLGGVDQFGGSAHHHPDHSCTGHLAVPGNCSPPHADWTPIPAPRKHLAQSDATHVSNTHDPGSKFMSSSTHDQRSKFMSSSYDQGSKFASSTHDQGSKFMTSFPCFSNGQFHSSPSLPEVHVDHNTMTIEKPTIKRSTTESGLADRIPSTTDQRREEYYSSQTFPRKDADRKHVHTHPDVLWLDSKSVEPMDVSPTTYGGGSGSPLPLTGQRSDQCQSNDYNLPGFRSHISDLLEPETSNTSTSFTISAPSRAVDPSYTMEVETCVEVTANYSSPSPSHSCLTIVNSGREEVPVSQHSSGYNPIPARANQSGMIPPQNTSVSADVCLQAASRSDCGLSPSSLFIEPTSPQTPTDGRVVSPNTKDYSADLAPPTREVMEMKRPTLKRGEKSPSLPRQMGQDDISRTVIIKEITSQRGDAKLVIECKPNLKKNIQTVHSRKVPHPPRQIAEAVDDVSDSVTPDMSSTGPSDVDPSGISSQDEDVFSDTSDAFTRFSVRSRRSPSGDKPHLLKCVSKRESTASKCEMSRFDDMIGSRSSLDESVLQLASERHDIFGASDSDGGDFNYNTGSLRVKRSQKMQSLVDLFEKVSDQNLAESGCQGDDKRLSMSLPTSSSTQQAERDQDTDDEAFFPPPRVSSISLTRRSRSRERVRKAGSDKENHITSRSPTPNRRQLSSSDRYAGGQQKSSSSPATKDYHGKGSAKYTSFSKPPRYRSGSRGRTHSESSTSESESSQHLDGSFHGRYGDPGGANTGGNDNSVLRDVNSSWGDKKSLVVQREGVERTPDRSGVQRRGSIKELMDFFESRQGEESSSTSGSTSTPSTTPTPTQPRRSRIQSGSPVRGDELSLATRDMATTSSLRLSLEIPSSAAVDANRKSQPLRLGPKPFYGAKH
ncbi:serine-rich adhesin for platelets-like isoform X3 [Gigantopelta aegis]|uniref:serine-rich adhesin for platelets-like isoform X3 n=1 Tax=Gigantopelta aegis TaxID=1735272 RepID=UPI001B88C5E7|nr:serine-rich adhesin for platelets-like isoform X3 [Gigantopelta aegis]